MPTQSFPKHLRGIAATVGGVAMAPEETGSNQLLISTAAENTAEALGINLADLEGMVGSGKDGLITVADVKNWGKEPEEG